MTDARTVAARVVARTVRDGAFAAAVLDSEMERAGLDSRDRAFATELTYGTLRVFPFLETRIGAYATRGTSTLAPEVRAHLAVAAYQILFSRVPAFAAVDAGVNGVRAETDTKVGGFANAVLRKLAKEEKPELAVAIEQSLPAWLREAIERSLGDRARAFFADIAVPPPVGLRVETESREAVIERLRRERPGATFEPGRVSPIAILARGAGRPQSLAAYRDAAISVQEEGSQALALALGAKSGECVLDACAGRGGKTAILARAVEPGRVDVCDLHASKLGRLGEELTRVGLRPGAKFIVDWTRGVGDVPGDYDRVLVDAPCSGSGTLRRRPDIALHRTEEDIARLAQMQLAILQNASTRVRVGGTVLYAVCSVLREEGEDVAARFLASNPGFQSASERRLLPMDDGTDGYFLATFLRVS